jgi:serine/threonine protein phosphatase PrpC
MFGISGEEPCDNKGCTANVLLIKDDMMYVSNAGDSRCILAINGKAVPMSVDHKPNLY